MHKTIIATLGFMGFQISSSLKSFTKGNFVVETEQSLTFLNTSRVACASSKVRRNRGVFWLAREKK